MWYVYMIMCNDGTLYTGITTNVSRRIAEHNTSNKGAKYTRTRRPVKLVWQCTSGDRSSASKEEYRIKKLKKSTPRDP